MSEPTDLTPIAYALVVIAALAAIVTLIVTGHGALVFWVLIALALFLAF